MSACPETVAAQLAEDLNDLLLIDDAAVGDGEDRLELRAEIGDLLRMQLVVDEARDGIHGAGAVERHDCRHILDGLRPHIDAHARNARRFQLEHARGLALGNHFEGRRVVFRDVLHGKVRLVPANGLFRVVNDRQVAQAEEVHLEQTQFLDGRHGELRDDRCRRCVASGT